MQKGNVPCFPFARTKSITKFFQKILGFKRELQAKGGLHNSIFSIGCQILKIYFFQMALKTRGGVQDKRLEAKDTKKIRGQGQPYGGQTLSRPRTGMLEAKAKTKDTSASALQKIFFQAIFKKKSLGTFFGDLQKIFHALHKLLTTQKKVLSSSRG